MKRVIGAVHAMRVVAFGSALMAGPLASQASDLGYIWPSSDSEMGAVSWTGIIFNPDAGYETLNFGQAGSTVLKDAKGARAGGEIGYDLQLGDIVIGTAADGFYSWIDGKGSGLGSSIFKSDLKYFGTVRGRLGYALGRFLPYATGGWAFGELEINNKAARVMDSNTLNGWVAGGGLEYAWNKSVTLRGEYEHVDFGSDSYASLPESSRELSAEMDLFKFAVISRF